MNRFQTACVSDVSPHEHDQQVEKEKDGDKMEEESRRAFGESSEEVVERRGDEGEEAVQARARKVEITPSDEVVEPNFDHAVVRSWCPHCAKGKAESYRHARRVKDEGAVPKIGVDYMHMRSEQRAGGGERHVDYR